MHAGRIVFAQLIDHLPPYEFHKCVERYRGNYKLRGFSCWDQFLCLAFAQLTYRESLRDIEACLRSVQSKLYHMGFRGKVSRSTLADANEAHDWRIFADLAQILIHIARPIYANESLGFDLDNTVRALDSHHHRSLLIGVSMGALSNPEGPEPNSFYLMDRGYLDFERLHVFHGSGAFFVT